MANAFVCQGVRTPIGRYAGALSPVRTDDLAAAPLNALRQAFQESDWESIDEVLLGCVNQAGEDNRNVARMASLIADVPKSVPAVTVNRLCASGMEAVASAARGIGVGEISLAIAGGVESMTRSPLVIPKAASAFSRNAEIHDTTLGWRFVNPLMEKKYGTASMAETAENVAEKYKVDRESQDRFALRSQQKAAAAQKAGILAEEIICVNVPGPKGTVKAVSQDEHIRPDTTLEALAKLPTPFRKGGTVTAGNASGINDGAAAMFVASEEAAVRFGLTPIARVVRAAAAGVDPNYMGIGPIPAMRKLLARVEMSLDQIDILELNEAFAAQALAVTRDFGLPDDCEKVNPNGGAIALGHPLGMSGARLVLTAALQLRRTKARYAIASMCVGVGQGMAMLLERV
ncbi:MAG TPA: 3-oxoadipyl-CoA thiolase [Bryobacteraceae bacterium]|nr:3-oxoadipyl-CoA thiolase [Bryobacteraceae bacterium]